MRDPRPVVFRLFPEPRFADSSLDVYVDAGCVSYRERERGRSELRIRTLFIVNHESTPFLAHLQFNRDRQFVVVSANATTRIDVDYFFETPTVEGIYPRSHGILRLYRTSRSVVAIEKPALTLLRRELSVAYRFIFDVRCAVGREGVIVL
jgi:hypothetical protein